jgi:hypothetical protein
MNYRERQDLDRHITGNYGEDQFKHTASRFNRRRTRAKVAANLVGLLERGPAFFVAPLDFTPEDALRQVRGWIDSWIMDDLRDLLANDLKRKS